MTLAVLAVYYFDKWTKQDGPLDHSVLVYIPKGAGSAKVADILTEFGVIDKPLVFRIYGRIKGVDRKIKAGEYKFNPQMPMVEVLNKIVGGDVFYHQLTLPEGLTTKQFIDIINAEEALSGEISINVKEGQMLPETYTFELGTDRDKIIAMAAEAMDEVVRDAWNNKMSDLPVKNPKQLVILASIIEKETGIAAERGLVASVFINRLKKGMKLQTDPTIIYAITDGNEDLGRSLKRADMQIDSPYNTYKYYGLPPTPICNPGREAIYAAANPEESQYLYFVADGKGGHNFSVSYREHTNHVNTWVKGRRKK